jgi:hypothetical protein
MLKTILPAISLFLLLVKGNNNSLNSVVRVGRICYYLKNGFKSVFPDRYTLETMGFSFSSIPFVAKDVINRIPNSIIPLLSLWDHHSNKKMLSLGNSSFIISKPMQVFTLMLNPCYVYWNENIVMTWRTDPNVFRVSFVDKSLRYRGIDNDFDIASDISMLKSLSVRLTRGDKSIPHFDMRGEDPRLVTRVSPPSSESLWLVFSKRHHRGQPELQMSYCQLSLSLSL